MTHLLPARWMVALALCLAAAGCANSRVVEYPLSENVAWQGSAGTPVALIDTRATEAGR